MRSPSRSRSAGSPMVRGTLLSTSAAAGVAVSPVRDATGFGDVVPSAMQSAAVSPAPDASTALITADVGCSMVAGSDLAAGGEGGRVLVSDAIPSWYTQISMLPSWPLDGYRGRFQPFRRKPARAAENAR